MYFDQFGKQHVSRRRRPSPVRKARHQRRPPSAIDDSSFSQDIWPRPDRIGTIDRIKKSIRGIFVPRTKERPADGESGRNKPKKNSRGGRFSLPKSFSPVAWFKKLAVAAGIIVFGLVATNWDAIAEKFSLQGIPMGSLEDPMEARWDFSWRTNMFSSPEETATVSIEETVLNVTERFIKTEYTVKPGDTTSSIAAQFSLLQGSIISLNKMKNAWDIKAGATLLIPNMDGIPYTVQRNDSISKIAAKMKVPQNAILDANDISNARIVPGDELFIPGARMSASDLSSALRPGTSEKPMIRPVAGRITSGYGWREDPVNPKVGETRFHRAVDIAGRMGDPIKASMRGTVQHIDNNPNLGNFIIIKHENGYQSLYAHLSRYSVSVGQVVQQGQEVGKIGDTGYTTGPHLHFEVFRNGIRVNPLDLVQ